MSVKITKITGVVVNAFTGKQVTIDTVLEQGALLAVVSGEVVFEVNGRSIEYDQGDVIDVELIEGNVALDHAAVDDAEAIERALANGDDINQVLSDMEATAAGGAGDEGGHSFVDIAFLNSQGHVTAGFETIGIPASDSLTIQDIFEDQREDVIAAITTPTDPETPIDPENPTDPQDPSDPEKPVDPEDPTDPEEPENPGNGNNGHGNNTDGQDDNNPGQGHGGPNGDPKDGDDEDEGETGNHGDDTPGSNQGNGGGNVPDNSSEESPNGGGSDNNSESNGKGPKGNNGYGNGDQDAPGNSGPHNNAENAGDESVPVTNYPGNSGHGFDNLIVHGNPHID